MSWTTKGKVTQVYLEVDYIPKKKFTADVNIREYNVDLFPIFFGIIFSHYILPQLLLTDESKISKADIYFTTGIQTIWNRRF